MKRTVHILTLITVLCLAFPARQGLMAQGSEATETSGAEGQPSLATLEISLWPEFDRPDLLVIYRGLLAEETSLPAPVEISVPADIVAPSAVAYVDETGQRLNLEYSTRVEGEVRIVSFDLPSLGFQLEYYDALPIEASGRRTYTFDFRADYDVTDLGVEFQVPPTAQNFVLEPPADSVVPDSGGVAYHVVDAGALAQGERMSWTFRYDKDNPDLTLAALEQAQEQTASALPTTTAPAEGDSSTGVVFFVAFVALVAVGGAAFWLGRRTGNNAAPDDEAPFPPRKKRPERRIGRDAFCHRCGTQLRHDSEFCHKCGARVRQE
jgi:hypothetical protein